MVRLIILIVTLLALASSVHAQAPDIEWSKTFGDSLYDWAWWVEETSDSGCIMAGYTYTLPHGQGEEQMYVAKLDRHGALEWDETYGDSLMDVATCVRETTGGYVVAGYSTSYPPGGADFRLLKIDPAGTEVWAREYGAQFDADYAQGVCQTLDGNFMVVGDQTSDTTGWDIQVIKTDAGGNALNEVVLALNGTQHPKRIQATSDGGAIVVGTAGQLFLMKLDAAGHSSWLKGYGGASFGQSVIQLADGGYAAFGSRSFPTTDYDFWLLRLDAQGDSLWYRYYRDGHLGYSVRQTRDGGFIMVGEWYPPGQQLDIYVVRTDSVGDTLWTKSIGGAQQEYAYCVEPTADGGYLIAGRTRSYGAGDYDMYLVKLASDSGVATGVTTDEPQTPSSFRLGQNYPNPFNPATRINYTLSQPGHVKILIANILGRHVRRLVDGPVAPGSHSAIWDGRDDQGRLVATGIYVYRLQTDGQVETRKMVLLR